MRTRIQFQLLAKLTISALSVLLFFNFSYAQQSYPPRLVKKMESSAKEFFRIGEFKNALPIYRVLDSLNPLKVEYSYRLGVCYLHSNYKNKALKHLIKALNKPGIPDDQHFYLGRAYHLDHSFHEAIQHYETYINILKTVKNPNDPIPISKKSLEEQTALTKRYIEMCENGKTLMLSPLNITVKNLGPNINSKYDDFAPLMSIDEGLLIFTSTRLDSSSLNSNFLDLYEDVYISRKVDGEWTQAQNIGAPVNTDNHDAAVGLSPDGEKIIIYKARSMPTINHTAAGDLYMTKIEEGKWSEPKMIEGEINSKFWEPSASITENEQFLFFTSDRDGGIGGRDIYMAKKLPNGDWAKPRNLGEGINTPYDEDGPFIHPDGNKLYFSSKGHNSIGGFDIFMSKYDAEKDSWSKPENLGYPINTADDDIYFVWSSDGKRAYFSSAREDSYGETDIYMVYKDEDHFSEVVVEGSIYDTNTHQPLLAEIVVKRTDTDQIVGKYQADTETNKFTMILLSGQNYELEISSDSISSEKVMLKIPGTEAFQKIEKNLYIELKKEDNELNETP